MRKRPSRFVAPLWLLLWLLPSTAWASSMPGVLTWLGFAFFVTPLTVAHVTVTLVFALRKDYRKLIVAAWQVLLASIAPLFGKAVIWLDYNDGRRAQEQAEWLMIANGLLVLAWVPLLIHLFQRNWRAGQT